MGMWAEAAKPKPYTRANKVPCVYIPKDRLVEAMLRNSTNWADNDYCKDFSTAEWLIPMGGFATSNIDEAMADVRARQIDGQRWL
jgi:hypothetical protein